MHSAGDLVMCLGDINGRWVSWRKNAIRVLSREGIMCVKYMV